MDPIRRSTLVRSSAEHAFAVFTERLGEWWPAQPYSLGQERVRSVTVDRLVGGRVYETWDDGTTRTWGHVLTWQPPTRFGMTWEAFEPHTEVELVFRPLGPALTRVELEHRGWEALDRQQLASATSAPGGYSRGWEAVLAALGAAVEGEV